MAGRQDAFGVDGHDRRRSKPLDQVSRLCRGSLRSSAEHNERTLRPAQQLRGLRNPGRIG